MERTGGSSHRSVARDSGERAAKEVLADEPDNLTAPIAIGYGGYVLALNAKNESGNAEAITYAKKAIQLIESGKTLENWSPFNFR